MDPSVLPQTAIEHLYPFLLLGGLSVITLGAIIHGMRTMRNLVREESIAALKEDEGQKAIREVVAAALTGAVEPLKDAIAEQRRAAIAQGERIGKLEQWQARADVALGVLAKQAEHLGRLDRWVIEFGKILKRAKLTDNEEIGS